MHRRLFRSAAALLAASLLTLAAGCAGSSRQSHAPVFFPPSPNLPRLQYLTSFSNSADVLGTSGDSVSLISVGKEEEQKVSRIIKPSGITSRDGKLYVTDIAGQLFVVDLANKKMEQLKGNDGLGQLKKPIAVAVDHAGFVFVTDIERKEVLIYDNNGEYLKSVGGDLNFSPTDIAVDNENLYVLDTRKSVIHVLDPMSGAQIREIGKLDEPTQSLSLPTRMNLDDKGVLWVTNAGTGAVISYDRDGHFLGSFGKFGDGMGQFTRPKGITTDSNGYVYVVDSGFQNVQIFTEQGKLLGYFGSAKIPVGGMNLPSDITISTKNLDYFQKFADKDFELSEIIFVANQFGENKIGVYGLGKLRGVDYEAAYRKASEEREHRTQELLKERKKQQEMQEQQSKKDATAKL
ncbi:NHL repeat-containing protein [Geomonas edaphica]|uniref:hypothetical protein n=1 Tax=Geomonas edaphica TaxID=2570226 RepID=UPI0010A8C59B|nr:hypothetical protein [Geomonas edaphica]